MKCIFLTTILSILLYSYTKACDCDEERKPIKELVKSSKVVFVGTVISSKSSKVKNSLIGGVFIEVVLKIDNLLFGDFSSKEITIYTEKSDCGQFLRKGQSYLVYAFENQNRLLEISQCHSTCYGSNTNLAENDLEEIKKLNLKKKP